MHSFEGAGTSLMWGVSFTTEWRFISTCSLVYDIHVVTCLHKFRRSCQWSILINLDKCNFLILVNKFSEKKFEDVKKWTFASGCKPKGVWSSSTYIHKSRGKSTGVFKIEKRKIHLNHEPRRKFWDINGWTSVFRSR